AGATSNTTEGSPANNLLSVPVSIGDAPPPDSVTEIRVMANDLAWDAVGGRIYASVPNAQVDLGNTLVSFNPLSGQYDLPIPVGKEPSKLAVTANGQYLYAGINFDNAIQRVGLSNRAAEPQFPTGHGYAHDMAVVPGRPGAVVATAHTIVVMYENGVALPNAVWPTEYNQPYYLAITSSTNGYNTYPT